MPRRKLFISAVSREFDVPRIEGGAPISYRREVERYLRTLGYDTVSQDYFTQSDKRITDKLRQHITGCDAVICLVGDSYGYEPKGRKQGEARRSYTQIEYDLALELGKPLYLMIANTTHLPPLMNIGEDTPSDKAAKPELKIHTALQKQHLKNVKRNRDYSTFDGIDRLRLNLSMLEFPWGVAGAAPEYIEDPVKLTETEKKQLLAGEYGVPVDSVPGSLPVYAAAYLQQPAAEAERLADNEIHRIAAEEGSMHDLALARWIAGLCAIRAERWVIALEHLKAAEDIASGEKLEGLSVRTRSAMGYVHYLCGRYDNAEREFRDAANDAERIFGSENPLTLGLKANLAAVLVHLHKPKESMEILDQVLAIRRRHLGMEHPRTLCTRNTLANSLSDLGRYDEAEEHYHEVFHVYTRELGPEHPLTLLQMYNVASNLIDQGSYSEAEDTFDELLKLCRKTHGDSDSMTGRVLNELSWLHLEYDDPHCAERYAVEAVSILRKWDRRHPETLNARHTLATVRFGLNQNERAKRDFSELIKDQVHSLGIAHPATLTSRYDFARLLHSKACDANEVKHQLEQAIADAETKKSDHYPVLIKCRTLLRQLSADTSIKDDSAGLGAG